MEQVSFKDLKIGQVYDATSIPEYETNDAGHKIPLDDPENLLVRVVDKRKEGSKTSKVYGKVLFELIRDYDAMRTPVVYPVPIREVYYDDFIFREAHPAQVANATRKRALNKYKRTMVEVRGTKKLHSSIPANALAGAVSYLTGDPGKSVKNQEAALQKHIKHLEAEFKYTPPKKPELNGGRRRTRLRRTKRAVKTLKRKV
jgi:hypothetical protein